jgi:hypothetical protein
MSIELSADLQTNLRREKNGTGVPHVPRTDRRAEMCWIAQPDPRFIGNWVALDGDRVLASASTAKAVYDQAKSKGIEVPFVAYVSPHRDEPFAGGWLD